MSPGWRISLKPHHTPFSPLSKLAPDPHLPERIVDVELIPRSRRAVTGNADEQCDLLLRCAVLALLLERLLLERGIVQLVQR